MVISNMINRLLSFGIIGILGSVVFFHNSQIVEWIDNAVLLEKRHPGYFNYLSPEKGEKLYILEFYTGKNLIISRLNPSDHMGFSIVINDDGSITINGTNNEEDTHIRYGRIELADGTYCLLDGGASSDFGNGFSYVYDEDMLAHLPDDPTFIADRDSHGSYEIGIVIFRGCGADDLTFYPMLERGEFITDYQPYISSIEYGNCIEISVYKLDKEEFLELADADFRLFNNSISSSGSGGDGWISILFKDGTGIQIMDGKKQYGFISNIGEIIEPIQDNDLVDF